MAGLELLGIDDGTRVLVVSPHFDDAVLSAWAVLDGGRLGQVDVVTIFGGAPAAGISTPNDTRLGFSSGAEAIDVRRREDEGALTGVARRRWWLPLLELQYRGDADRDQQRSVISAAIMEWLDAPTTSASAAVVIVPAGAGARLEAGLSAPSAHGSRGRGGPALAWLRALKHRLYVRRKHAAQRAGALAHPDHLFVRDVVLDAVAGRNDVKIFFFEDLPYLWSGGADDEIAAVAHHGGFKVSACELPVDRTAKCAALAHYSSQLAALDPVKRRLESADALPEFERYWRLSSSRN